MPAFGEGSPFGQIQPTDLSNMLQAVFSQAPMPEYMAIPSGQRPQADFIDLGAGGPAPGSQRSSGLGSLGQLIGQAGQIAGAAMAANQRPQWTGGDINVTRATPVNTYQPPGSIKPMDIPITRVPMNPIGNP